MKGRLLGAAVLLFLIGMIIYWGEGLDREQAFTPEANTGDEWADDTGPGDAAVDAGHLPAPAQPAGDVPAAAVEAQREEQPAEQGEPSAPAEQPDPTQRPPEPAGPLRELKSAYAAGSADADAEPVERLIRSLFGTEYIPEEAFRSVSCHRTVCKIGLTWSRQIPLAYMGLAMKLGENKITVLATDPLSGIDRKGEMPLDIYALRAEYTLEDVR